MQVSKHVERLYRRLGANIRQARQRAGASQEWLAKQIGLTRVSAVNIEAGRQRILLHQVKRIAAALGVDPLKLLRGIW